MTVVIHRAIDDILGRSGDHEVTELMARRGGEIENEAIDERLGRTASLDIVAPHVAGSGEALQRIREESGVAAASASATSGVPGRRSRRGQRSNRCGGPRCRFRV